MNYSIFPIKDRYLWEFYKKSINAFWTVEEIDFSNDKKDFETLTEEQKKIIKTILGFFSNSDGLVNFNISKNLLNFTKEITFNYVYQMFIEQIHNECYSLMIETLIDEEEKDEIFNSMVENDIIKEISQWGLRYIENDIYDTSNKILVFICFEGIMFSGAFAIIYWLKSIYSKGKKFMNGLIKSNEFISRDESFHVEFGVSIFNKYYKDIPNYIKTRIILECVYLTKKFNNEVLKTAQIGINEKSMNTYSEYVADRIFVMLGLDKYYKVSNPFSFMDTIGMVQRTNFHESIPTEYSRCVSKNIEINEDDF